MPLILPSSVSLNFADRLRVPSSCRVSQRLAFDLVFRQGIDEDHGGGVRRASHHCMDPVPVNYSCGLYFIFTLVEVPILELFWSNNFRCERIGDRAGLMHVGSPDCARKVSFNSS